MPPLPDAARAIRVSGADLLLAVACRPRRRSTAIAGMREDSLLVDLRAAPEGGRANEELLRHLSERLGIARDRMRITAGRSARRKCVRVAGGATLDLAQRLAGVLPSGDRSDD
jgi:uncharacterized protein YggU (UPF0235/DUF167 family)